MGLYQAEQVQSSSRLVVFCLDVIGAQRDSEVLEYKFPEGRCRVCTARASARGKRGSGTGWRDPGMQWALGRGQNKVRKEVSADGGPRCPALTVA